MAKVKKAPVKYEKPALVEIPPEYVRITRCRGLVARYWDWVEQGRPTRDLSVKRA